LTLPSNITTLGNNIFSNNALTNVDAALTHLTSIGSSCFENNQITSLTLSSSLTSIGDGAFNNNDNLSSVTFTGNAPTTIGSNIFSNTAVTTVYVYSNTTGWSQVNLGLPITVTTPNPTSNICFPGYTILETDQGSVAIQEIDPAFHTIDKKPIVALTKTVSNEDHLVKIYRGALGNNVPCRTTVISQNHCLLFRGKMTQAIHLIRAGVKDVSLVKYNGEYLYNILMEEHEKTTANNMVVETLDPNNYVSKFYRNVILNDKLTEEEKLQSLVHANHYYMEKCRKKKNANRVSR